MADDGGIHLTIPSGRTPEHQEPEGADDGRQHERQQPETSKQPGLPVDPPPAIERQGNGQAQGEQGGAERKEETRCHGRRPAAFLERLQVPFEGKALRRKQQLFPLVERNPRHDDDRGHEHDEHHAQKQVPDPPHGQPKRPCSRWTTAIRSSEAAMRKTDSAAAKGKLDWYRAWSVMWTDRVQCRGLPSMMGST